VKKILLSVFVALLGLSFVALDAQAKRLGGGSTSGMQRQMPAKPTPTSPPAQQAPTAAPATAGAPPPVAPKRSWMGPLAGLAAGLGLAALMSHFGMGAELGNLVTMLLVGALAFIAIRFAMRRFGTPASDNVPAPSAQGLQYAGAGFGGGPPPQELPSATGAGPIAVPTASAPALPAGFDGAAFERIAKLIFIRMQTANDKADLDDLRQFATPEMFAVFKLDLQDRKDTQQQTDVVQLNAQVLDFAQEATRQIVSVRFHGLIREEKDGPAAPFDEVWHLVKPADGSHDWAIAGIAQYA
jgi:predicted lipid-binding transport protein (Tim44 family)